MSSTLDLCEKFFGTRDIYELMGIEKNALQKDGNYHTRHISAFFLHRFVNAVQFFSISLLILCFFLTVKKAYYRLSLQVHPDRVAEADKLNATQKFQVLTKLNGVLSDTEKKALYDEQGIIDDEDSNTETDWEKLWKQYFKPISDADIENFKKGFIGEFS